MALKLIIAASTYPVTLAEAKAHPKSSNILGPVCGCHGHGSGGLQEIRTVTLLVLRRAR